MKYTSDLLEDLRELQQRLRGAQPHDFEGIYDIFDDLLEALIRREANRLAPTTVKREVALYRLPGVDMCIAGELNDGVFAPTAGRRISEPVTIEFSLLPGESE